MADSHDPHAGHDPLVIARLLDRGAGGEDRAIAEARVASCPDCAALHDDLLALSVATREQPIPARPRAFTLTTADAARLAGEAAGEPGVATARLGVVMTEPIAPSDHAVHDTMLVASLADHSLAEGERARAQALVAACSQCADLHADLLALRAATRAMPTPARPHDYQLTQGDAVRIRSGGWRRFIAILGTSRDALSRPLAAGLTTLGLAGLLIANAPSFMPMGGSTAAPTVSEGAPAGAAANNGDGSTILGASAATEGAASNVPPPPGDTSGSAGRTTEPVRAAPLPGGTTPPQPAAGVTAAPDTQGATNGSTDGGSSSGKSGETADGSDLLLAQDIGGASPLVVLSLAFLIAGLGLFGLRWTARRLGRD